MLAYVKTLVLLAVAINMLGCGKPLEGDLQISKSEGSIAVKNADQSAPMLTPGAASVKIKDAQWIGKDFRLIIKNGPGQVELKIPTTAFLSAQDFDVSGDEIGQEFDLRARKSTTKRGPVKIVERQDSCTYIGVCSDCATNYEGQRDCSFRLQMSCNGHEAALYNAQELATQYQISFMRAGKTIGVFSSKPEYRTEMKFIKTTGSCG